MQKPFNGMYKNIMIRDSAGWIPYTPITSAEDNGHELPGMHIALLPFMWHKRAPKNGPKNQTDT
ncbi:hypothetical protein Metfor_1870 [Methanoregula formicica SMSP]|uniref:Uncharacterized protein n=1 Tax=Methanoregula formicica (strain DSM 22288 / NBRC 105244 / SMSP) TaxID=593750 RepID=L0HGH2_METFS|nr:hypothetical protein Metfor_1870 [Methanoregula formicica SMSP]